MKVIVINLKTSKNRLTFQTNQLKSLDLTFTVLPALSPDDLSKSEIPRLSLGWERQLKPTEVACFLSHKAAWQLVSENKEPVLIIEDDALLSTQTKKLLKSLLNKDSADLVALETRSRKKIISKIGQNITPAPHMLYELYQDRTGTAGYVLWPSGARKLLLKSRLRPPAPADAFISSCYSLNAYQVEPAAIIQLDQCENYGITNNFSTQSTINLSQAVQPKTCLLHLITCKLRRITSQLRMGFRQLSVLRISIRRHITISTHHFQLPTSAKEVLNSKVQM